MEDGADQRSERWDAADDEDDPLFGDGGQGETRDEERYVVGSAEGRELGGFDSLRLISEGFVSRLDVEGLPEQTAARTPNPSRKQSPIFTRSFICSFQMIVDGYRARARSETALQPIMVSFALWRRRIGDVLPWK